MIVKGYQCTNIFVLTIFYLFKDAKGKPLKKRGSLKSMYDGQAGNIGAINEYAWKDLR